MECTEYVDVLNKVGLPLTLLGIVVYAIFKIVGWFAPRIDKYVTEYMEVAKRKADILEQSSIDCAKHQAEMASMLSTINQTLSELERRNVTQNP